MYWSNKEIDCDVKEVTSLNFLSGYLLEMAGVKGTDFLSYVNKLSHEITAINAAGWIDNDMVFHPLSYKSKDLPDNLQLYSSLQYNGLFDEENRLTPLFEVAVDDPEASKEEETTGDGGTTGEETTVDIEPDIEDTIGTEETMTGGGIADMDIAA